MKAIKINTFIFSIVFKRLFNKGNRKHFFRVPIEFIETLVKVWEKLEIAWKHSISRFSQTFTRVSITL
jgi:DNA-binding transcriptional regulator GbsR (MarR family)